MNVQICGFTYEEALVVREKIKCILKKVYTLKNQMTEIILSNTQCAEASGYEDKPTPYVRICHTVEEGDKAIILTPLVVKELSEISGVVVYVERALLEEVIGPEDI